MILFCAIIIAVILSSACTSEPESIENKTTPTETELPPLDTEFCGRSTNGACANDNDCMTGGCSGQVCQSKNEEPVITTCEYRECYDAKKYNAACRCTQSKCQWTLIHAQ